MRTAVFKALAHLIERKTVVIVFVSIDIGGCAVDDASAAVLSYGVERRISSLYMNGSVQKFSYVSNCDGD